MRAYGNLASDLWRSRTEAVSSALSTLEPLNSMHPRRDNNYFWIRDASPQTKQAMRRLYRDRTVLRKTPIVAIIPHKYSQVNVCFRAVSIYEATRAMSMSA